MTIWSRSKKYREQIEGLTARLDAAVTARANWEAEAHHLTAALGEEQAAHRRTHRLLVDETRHSGMLHRDLVELRDATYSGDVTKRLSDRLAQFTQQSVDSDLAVSDALADHAKNHRCVRREPTETPAPATVEPVVTGGAL